MAIGTRGGLWFLKKSFFRNRVLYVLFFDVVVFQIKSIPVELFEMDCYRFDFFGGEIFMTYYQQVL